MINYNLSRIKAILFDIDGVLSAETITISAEGVPLRTVNIKDGYAIQLAVKCGVKIGIITGASVESIRLRYEGLGVKDIFLGCAQKLPVYEAFKQKYALEDEEIIYMGDDIPDMEVMQQAGCACCPSDAAPEIREISLYISHLRGGYGCGRDVIEQVLKAQGHWLTSEKAFGW